MKKINFQPHVIRQSLSSRGGGIEIDLTSFGFENHKMAVYQNYLGGGLLGAIMVNDTIRAQASNVRLQLMWSSEYGKLDKIGSQLKRYMHDLTNPDTEWESATFEENQSRPGSAY